MKYFVNKLKTNTLFKTYILIIMPVAVLMITLLVLNIMYTSNYRKMLEKSYVSGLTSMYNENEKAISSTVSGIHMLAHNNGFMEAVRAKNPTEEQTAYITSLIDSIERSNTLIHSIIIFDRARNGVYTSRGRARLDTLKYRFNYQKYNEEYWMEYKAPLSAVQTLAPSMINEGSSATSVLPVVFTQIGEERLSKLIVLNIDISSVLYKMNDLKFTENSSFYIMSRSDGQLLNTGAQGNLYADDELYGKITNQSVCITDHRVENSGMNMIISLSPTVSKLGYSYVVMIPLRDINKKLMGFMLAFLCFSVLAVGGAVLMVHISTKKIGSLFEGIASLFGKDSDDEADENDGDIVEYITAKIRGTLYENENLESEFSIALPIVMEKYLLNLLNRSDYYADPGMERAVKNFIKFEYDYFMLVIIKMDPTEKLYEEFTSPEYQKIKEGIYDILKELLSDSYFTYILPSEANTLYIVLNLNDDTAKEEISERLSQLMKMFEVDREYMHFSLGMGNVHRGISGLKKSYDEAQETFVVGNAPGKAEIKQNRNQNEKRLLSAADENRLYRLVLENRTDEAKAFADSALAECRSSGADDAAVLRLLAQMFNTVLKVMRLQNIAYANSNLSEFDIMMEILTGTPQEAYDMLCGMLGKISDILSATHSKIDVMAIITYIEENYTAELSLDILADRFDTSPKYISKLVKDKLGISFVEYVAGLRINRATELLENTDRSVMEIYTETGFNNRNTFIRTFKNFMGITPSEYREIKRAKRSKA